MRIRKITLEVILGYGGRVEHPVFYRPHVWWEQYNLNCYGEVNDSLGEPS